MFYLIPLLALGASAQFNPCPLPGPAFPAPSKLSSNPSFEKVTKNITEAIQNAFQTGSYPGGGFFSNATAYSISIFSVDEPDLLYEYHHTPPSFQNASVGVKTVDADTVYRIASISKLYTVYAILASIGDGYWDRAVTDFLPELAQDNADPVNYYQWDRITLGQLAGYTSGLGRDYLSRLAGQSDFPPAFVAALGLPPLEPYETPVCEYNQTTQSCPVEDVIKNINTKHPVFAPNSVASYSNAAFEILASAVASIVGKPFYQILNETVVEPLSLKRTFYSKPDNSLGAIPGDVYDTLWDRRASEQRSIDPASGNYFSSTSDLAAVGRSILASSILDVNTTRAWLKPHTFTASLLGSVGLPWEIFRAPLYGERVTDIYAKSGSFGAYTSNLALLPDYGVGYSILVATPPNTIAGQRAPNVLVSDILVPALEDIAREQAVQNFAGRYVASNGLNSSIELTAEAGYPGLKISELTINGTSVLALAGTLLELVNPDVRLYPTDLKNKREDGSTEWAFRFNIESEQRFKGSGPYSACGSWFNPDAYAYGVYSLDEYLFLVDAEGMAVSVTPRAWKIELEKTNSKDPRFVVQDF